MAKHLQVSIKNYLEREENHLAFQNLQSLQSLRRKQRQSLIKDLAG